MSRRILPRMKAIERVTTVVIVLLTLTVPSLGAQQPSPAFDVEMRNGEQAMQRQDYEQAIRAYKKAYSLSKKSSFDAAAAMVLAYRALGASKNALDAADEALKLAGQDAHRLVQAHNLRGSVLYSLSAKPDDPRMKEAESEFRAALALQDDYQSARFNLGMALLKQSRDDEGVRELRVYVEHVPAGTDTVRAKKIIEDPRRARFTFAPSFSFTSRGGEAIALDDLKGKTVLIDFWGSWCPPCVQATPSLIKLHKKYAEQGVVFLGIAKDREKDWAGYIDKHHLEWPQFLDSSNTLVHQFAVTGYPTFIIIDGDGIIRGRRMGFGSDVEHWLESEIRDSLKRSQ